MTNPHCGNCIWWAQDNDGWGYCYCTRMKYTPEVSTCRKWIQNPTKEDNANDNP